MSAKVRQPDQHPESYLTDTLKPLYSLFFVLPLLIVFHLGTRYYRPDVYVLSFFKGTLICLPPLAVITVLLIQHLVKRDRWEIRLSVLGGMAVESALWVLPLMALGHITAIVVLTATQPAEPAGFGLSMFAMGGGIYEEFVFHLLGIGLVMLVFVDCFSLPKIPVAVFAVIVTSVLFALFHTNIVLFHGGDEYGSHDFTFRFTFRIAAGLCLGACFILRGFGVAVGAHIMWNIYTMVI